MLLIGLAAFALGACAASTPRSTGGISAARSPAAATGGGVHPLSRDDVRWLERVDFGVDSRTLSDYERLGRVRYLQQQLHPAADDAQDLPPAVAARIASLDISHLDLPATFAALRNQRRKLPAGTSPAQRQQALRSIFRAGSQLAAEASERELLRAVYSSDQLREQMVWFWLNHFSVFQNKAQLRWLVADYEEQAIRPYALGHFGDLVMATLESPAMLQYLDNYRDSVGQLNENYAREFLELHTLGVGSGYTQQDVQQLARVFTGVGVNFGRAPRLPPPLRALYVRSGGFEFNPARHDFGSVTLLGHHLEGQGFDEVSHAVSLIVRQPACARFISRELASYFVADDPPPPLVAAMARTFQRTDGDIAAVLRTMFGAPQFTASLGTKFKDPFRYVVSAVRLAYDGRVIDNPQPLVNWVRALGEAPYGRQTPDGYPLTREGWSSPGQLSRRFDIARVIGSGRAPLFAQQSTPGPRLSDGIYREALEPFLAGTTRTALEQARSPAEWNAFLLFSPEFNYE
jgi:uncharacterized protein (DUF1800 family)